MSERPTLRQLEYLVTLADTLHFGDAAARCHVSQPALSAQVRELERTLGVDLVERTTRRVLLTPVGRDVAARARDVLRAVDDLGAAAAAARGPLVGPLRLGVIPTIAPYVLPDVLPTVRAAYPGLELQLREDFTDRLVDELVAGRLDLLLLALPVDVPGVDTMALVDEPFLVVAPTGDALSALDQVRPDQVDRHDLLLLQEGHCLRDQALALCERRPPSRARDIVDGTSLTTLVQMVANGLGVTLLPATAVPLEVHRCDEVTVRSFAPPAPGRTLGLAWRRSSGRARDFETLGGLLGEQLDALVRHDVPPQATATATEVRA